MGKLLSFVVSCCCFFSCLTNQYHYRCLCILLIIIRLTSAMQTDEWDEQRENGTSLGVQAVALRRSKWVEVKRCCVDELQGSFDLGL